MIGTIKAEAWKQEIFYKMAKQPQELGQVDIIYISTVRSTD